MKFLLKTYLRQSLIQSANWLKSKLQQKKGNYFLSFRKNIYLLALKKLAELSAKPDQQSMLLSTRDCSPVIKIARNSISLKMSQWNRLPTTRRKLCRKLNPKQKRIYAQSITKSVKGNGKENHQYFNTLIKTGALCRVPVFCLNSEMFYHGQRHKAG